MLSSYNMSFAFCYGFNLKLPLLCTQETIKKKLFLGLEAWGAKIDSQFVKASRVKYWNIKTIFTETVILHVHVHMISTVRPLLSFLLSLYDLSPLGFYWLVSYESNCNCCFLQGRSSVYKMSKISQPLCGWYLLSVLPTMWLFSHLLHLVCE